MRDSLVALQKDNEGKPAGIVVLTADIDEFDGKWVGTVLELGVSTYADSLNELRDELIEAVLLQLNEIERLGYVDEYLREHGVRKLELATQQEDLESPTPWGLVLARA